MHSAAVRRPLQKEHGLQMSDSSRHLLQKADLRLQGGQIWKQCNKHGQASPGLAAWMAALRLIMSQGCSPAASLAFMLSCLLRLRMPGRVPSPARGQAGGPGAHTGAGGSAAAGMAPSLSRSSLERFVGEKRGCSSARWSTALPAHDGQTHEATFRGCWLGSS